MNTASTTTAKTPKRYTLESANRLVPLLHHMLWSRVQALIKLADLRRKGARLANDMDLSSIELLELGFTTQDLQETRVSLQTIESEFASFEVTLDATERRSVRIPFLFETDRGSMQGGFFVYTLPEEGTPEHAPPQGTINFWYPAGANVTKPKPLKELPARKK